MLGFVHRFPSDEISNEFVIREVQFHGLPSARGLLGGCFGHGKSNKTVGRVLALMV